MKITVGGGTAIDEEGGVIRLDSAVISLYKRITTNKARVATSSDELIFAYCLRPGEQVRRVSENEYEVIF